MSIAEKEKSKRLPEAFLASWGSWLQSVEPAILGLRVLSLSPKLVVEIT